MRCSWDLLYLCLRQKKQQQGCNWVVWYGLRKSILNNDCNPAIGANQKQGLFFYDFVMGSYLLSIQAKILYLQRNMAVNRMK